MLFADAVATLERSRAIAVEAHQTVARAMRLRELRVLWQNTHDAYRKLCALTGEQSDDDTKQALMDALIMRETIVELMREERGSGGS